MSVVSFIRSCIARGMDYETALSAAEVHETANADALSARRTKDAARQKALRDRKNSNVSHVTSRESHDIGDIDPRAHVEYTSLPSLRSEELITPISPKGEMPPLRPKPNGFARFWEAYPNKVGKQAAEKAFARALKRVPGHDPPAQMLEAVERAKRSAQWLRGYIPHPTTWLNEGRWEDEPSEIIPFNGPQNGRSDPLPDAKRVAREANLRRAIAGSEIAARDRAQR